MGASVSSINLNLSVLGTTNGNPSVGPLYVLTTVGSPVVATLTTLTPNTNTSVFTFNNTNGFLSSNSPLTQADINAFTTTGKPTSSFNGVWWRSGQNFPVAPSTLNTNNVPSDLPAQPPADSIVGGVSYQYKMSGWFPSGVGAYAIVLDAPSPPVTTPKKTNTQTLAYAGLILGSLAVLGLILLLLMLRFKKPNSLTSQSAV